MPIYTYKCESKECGKITEDLFPMSHPSRIMCPHCTDTDGVGNEAVRQISTIGTYHMKGDNSSSTTPRKFLGGGKGNG